MKFERVEKRGGERRNREKQAAKIKDMRQNEARNGMGQARKDDPSQEQDTNIIMQLRKSVSLKGMKDVEFEDGKKVKVKPKIADAAMDKFSSYRTTGEKLKFQQKIAKSYKDLLSALKEK